jgi:hypothetical protein
MFVPHRKHTNGLLRPVTEIALLFYMYMIFVPYSKHTYGPPPCFYFLLLYVTSLGIGSLVKALCYKPESPGFRTWSGERFLPIFIILSDPLGHRFYSACNRNQYQKQKNKVYEVSSGVRRIRLATVPQSVAGCLDSVGFSASQNPIGLQGPLPG